MDHFSGTLTLDDGERVAVDLYLDGEAVSLRTGGNLIGSWPLKYCRVASSSRGALLLSIDGEKVVFEPEDHAGFVTVAAQQFRASSLADRIGMVREIPAGDARTRGRSDPATGSDRRLWKVPRWALPAGLGALVVAVMAMSVFSSLGDDTGDQTTTTTTVAPPSTITPPQLFDQDVEAFTASWNQTATELGVPVQVRGILTAGQFESQLAPNVTLQGRTADDGTIASIVLVIDPSGATHDDQLAISALGVAIAVASPELSGSGRAALLEQMGFSVSHPDLTDLDGAVEVGTTEYTISYLAGFNTLLFSVNERESAPG